VSASGGRPSARCALVIDAGGDGLTAANTLRRGGEQVLPLEKKRKPGDGCTIEWERRCCFTRPLKACAEEAQAKSGETGQVVGYAPATGVAFASSCTWRSASRAFSFSPSTCATHLTF
jgi:hypothetical protein